MELQKGSISLFVGKEKGWNEYQDKREFILATIRKIENVMPRFMWLSKGGKIFVFADTKNAQYFWGRHISRTHIFPSLDKKKIHDIMEMQKCCNSSHILLVFDVKISLDKLAEMAVIRELLFSGRILRITILINTNHISGPSSFIFSKVANYVFFTEASITPHLIERFSLENSPLNTQEINEIAKKYSPCVMAQMKEYKVYIATLTEPQKKWREKIKKVPHIMW